MPDSLPLASAGDPAVPTASRIPWHARVLLIRPRAVRERLARLHALGIIDQVPTLWQIELGVLRMWHRVFFRSDTVGTCRDFPVRSTRRASLLEHRLLRGPFLFWERAIAPLDHSGLAQPPWRMIRHLLAAHHDRHQFSYDLTILQATPGALDEVAEKARAVIAEATPRARWLRDLVVYDGYHENLLDAVEAARRGVVLADPDERDNPDVTFEAYMRWCLAQPATPAATWRAWRAKAFPAALPPAPSSDEVTA
jgi:hypothetical protein